MKKSISTEQQSNTWFRKETDANITFAFAETTRHSKSRTWKAMEWTFIGNAMR